MLSSFGHIWRACQGQEVRQVEAHLELRATESRRVGHGLVDAGDPERLRPCPLGIGR